MAILCGVGEKEQTKHGERRARDKGEAEEKHVTRKGGDKLLWSYNRVDTRRDH